MWTILKHTYVALMVIFLLAPMVIILAISFSSGEFLSFPPQGFSLRWYQNLFGDPRWASTLLNSIKIVVPTSILATILGVISAIALTRVQFRGRTVVIAVLMAPIVVPTIVIAAGVYSVYLQVGLNGTLIGFVAAHTILAIPYVLSIVMASMSIMSEQLENAASTLGANPWVTFRRVQLPLLAPSILSGFLFALVMSFDELIVSMFISTPWFRPVSVQMWSDVMGDINPTIAAIGSLLFTFSLVVVALEAWLRNRINHNSPSAKE